METVGGSIVVGSRGQHGTEEAGSAVCIPQAGSLKWETAHFSLPSVGDDQLPQPPSVKQYSGADCCSCDNWNGGVCEFVINSDLYILVPIIIKPCS